MNAPLSPHESLARVASGEWSIAQGRAELQRVIEDRARPVEVVILCDARAGRCACVRTTKHGANHECACGHEWSGQNVAGSADHPSEAAVRIAEHTGRPDFLNVARKGPVGLISPPAARGALPWSGQRFHRVLSLIFRRALPDARVTTRDVGND